MANSIWIRTRGLTSRDESDSIRTAGGRTLSRARWDHLEAWTMTTGQRLHPKPLTIRAAKKDDTFSPRSGRSGNRISRATVTDPNAGSACVGSRRRVHVGRRYGPLPLHRSDVPLAVGIPMTSSHSTNRQPGRDHRRRPSAQASLDRAGVLTAARETGLCLARTTPDGRLRIWMIGASEQDVDRWYSGPTRAIGTAYILGQTAVAYRVEGGPSTSVQCDQRG
jgi:hypothetical protein